MTGQLWEPCPRCDAEPVCVNCGLCARHCTCARRLADRKQITEFEKANPGFLADYSRHMEEWAKEK